MRYMNWDVLLFPDGSKTPLQEFKTGCYITQEPDATICRGSYGTGMPRYLPTVASFVPNMPLGSPLKISIHSWEAPIACPETGTLALQADWIWFEARVLLDGIHIAGIYFNQQAGWPQIVDTCLTKDGISPPLTFPAFHTELLTQNHWNAGESFGRIKIVIAEGLIRGQGSAFEKTRSIVCFSFQHAPLRILEDSGIAFPNPGMLVQLQNQIYNLPSPRKGTREPNPDAHGHSPRHRNVPARMVVAPSVIYQDPTGPGLYPSSNLHFPRPYWPQIPTTYDTYVDNSRYHTFGSWAAPPSSSSDLSMPDYSRSLTPASSRNLSNSAAQVPLGGVESDYYSPNGPVSNGTIAPTNTRVSSAANTPPSNHGKPSAATDARVSSYSNSQLRSVSVPTRDPAKSAIRESSDTVPEQHGKAENRINKKPAKDVKGRKEGRGGDLGLQIPRISSRDTIAEYDKENAKGSVDRSRVASESKRKRSVAFMPTAGRALSDANSSPSRKVSRLGEDLNTIDDLTVEGVVARAPLADVGNSF